MASTVCLFRHLMGGASRGHRAAAAGVKDRFFSLIGIMNAPWRRSARRRNEGSDPGDRLFQGLILVTDRLKVGCMRNALIAGLLFLLTTPADGQTVLGARTRPHIEFLASDKLEGREAG